MPDTIKVKHQKVKNINYRKFLDQNMIQFLTTDQIDAALNRTTGRYKEQAKSLILVLYYTGGRPIEVLNLQAKSFHKDGQYLKINMPSSKRGLPRMLSFPMKWGYVKIIYNYVKNMPDELMVFFKYRCNSKRTIVRKDGRTIERIRTSDRLLYYFKKWFIDIEGNITPYFMRHNRISRNIAKGMSLEDARKYKGSKTISGVMPYAHFTEKQSEKWSKYVKDE